MVTEITRGCGRASGAMVRRRVGAEPAGVRTRVPHPLLRPPVAGAKRGPFL
uniref:Uncharacterized protein n=1 Tax=Arundo donax TaxID=35708 RepID=A0A0A9TPQ5_ARUDO